MFGLDWSSIPGALPFLWEGMLTTLQITCFAVIAGILVGTLLAVMRLSPSRWLVAFATGYVTVFRSVPLVMVLFWFHLILIPLVAGLLFPGRQLELRLVTALAAFSLFEASYYGEIIRAGISSVSKGQWNAGLALGMTGAKAMRLVILPQAFRRMIPLLLTQAIVLFQDTTLVYVISLDDFFRKAYNIGNRDGTLNELILFAGAIYLVVCTIASGFVRQVQRKIAV
ncbi:MAG: ABC transporter permease subunit [Verrucomicrobia bacterium]|nr:ABC transporter permease subunit [Verrucomicrobiota bacterium]